MFCRTVQFASGRKLSEMADFCGFLGTGGGGHTYGVFLEQDVVDHGFILIRDVGDLGRHGEHDVAVRHRQEFGLACGEPVGGRRALALGTMPVAARVVGDVLMSALLAAHEVAAEDRGTAVRDGRHDLELVEADVAGVGVTPRRAVGAEDVRDLEAGTRHGTAFYAGGLTLMASPSSGLLTSRSVRVATWA